jgi:hypothetical protein
MSLSEVLIMIDQRINNLMHDLVNTPKGVQAIMIKAAIDELTIFKWSLEHPKEEIYTSTGFLFKSLE